LVHPRSFLVSLALVLAFVAAPLAAEARRSRAPSGIDTVELSSLPPEAQRTIQLVRSGGPFPFRRDGVIFENRERRLPPHASGYYREYTVPTPGRRDRGGRRVVAGAAGELYYSDDHYRSFRRVEGMR
jgi:ribonuclease T1